MFQLAIPIRWRKVIVLMGVGVAVLASAVGGAAWYLLRCDMRDYLSRAAAFPLNPNEQYLFACGYLWHSVDGGRVWTRLDSSGLPLATRDGFVAVDRKPGILYLGILINSQSSIYCWNCAWSFLRPALYVSSDGGRTWSFAYKFKRGPAQNGDFVGLFANPGESGNLWAIIRNNDEISHYATRTSGQNWKRVCYEYYFVGANGCEIPEHVLRVVAPGLFVSESGVK